MQMYVTVKVVIFFVMLPSFSFVVQVTKWNIYKCHSKLEG